MAAETQKQEDEQVLRREASELPALLTAQEIKTLRSALWVYEKHMLSWTSRNYREEDAVDSIKAKLLSGS